MRNATVNKHTWINFLNFYNVENSGRATRLGVFENGHDYWLEDGLPLVGVDFDPHYNAVQLMLGDKMTHTIRNVQKIQINFTLDEINDGLDITDADGRTTILRFEN
jgi:Family of unknown function (DUF5335)